MAFGIEHLGVSGGKSVNTGVKIESGLGVNLLLEERPEGLRHQRVAQARLEFGTFHF